MDKVIDYYFTPVSPWSYLGHARFVDIAKRHGASIVAKPVDFGKIFPVSGGLPLKQRSPQRQAYRLVELARWKEHLGVPLNTQPQFFPVPPELAARWIIAAGESGGGADLALTGALMRGVWAQERDISDAATIESIAASAGLDTKALAQRAARETTKERYDALTQEAIDRSVFGAPTYIYKGEAFWGQDRLDFLDRSLAK